MGPSTWVWLAHLLYSRSDQAGEEAHKAICALFPYAVEREKRGDSRLLTAFFHNAKRYPLRYSYWVHKYLGPLIYELLSPASPRTLKRVAILALPYLPNAWYYRDRNEFVRLLDSAATSIEHTDEVGGCVLDVLLQVAYYEGIKARDIKVTKETWKWVKKRPPLSSSCLGRRLSISGFKFIRDTWACGDIDLLKASLLVGWSQWDCPSDIGFYEMRTTVREEFEGVGMARHRQDMTERLEYVLSELDRGLGYIRESRPDVSERDLLTMKEQYEELREVLVELDSDVPENA